MRIVFMGTPAFAVPALDALVAAGHAVVAAYTQPPRPAGRRGRADTPSAVQLQAEALGVPVRYPVSLRTAEAQAAFAALNADVAVVAAYGLILPQAVLDAPRHGCLNIHGSLLPRWRGAAPVQRAILAGDAETGVCIMQMEAGLDTGPVRAEARTEVAGKDAGALTSELAELGARLLVEVLADLPGHPPVVQPEAGVTYAAKILKEELRLDFAQSAEGVLRQVSAFNPPGAWFEVGAERIRILQAELYPREGVSGRIVPRTILERAGHVQPDTGPDWAPAFAGAQVGEVVDDALTVACADGAIRPTLVQRAGRAAMSPAELLRGFPIPVGTRL